MISNRLLGLLLLITGLIWFVFHVQFILTPFIIAIIIAYLLDPFVRIWSKLKLPRAFATILTIVTFFAMLSLFFVMMTPIIVTQSHKLMEFLSSYSEQIDKKYWLEFLHNIKVISPALIEKLQEALNGLSSYIIHFTLDILQNLLHSGFVVVNILSLLIITPIITFYVLRDLPVIFSSLFSLVPYSYQEEAGELVKNLNATLSGYLRGQSYVCIFLGTYYAVALMLAGLESGFTIGLVTGLLSFIPYVGAICGSLLAITVAALQYQELNFLLIIITIFIMGQVIEGYFIAPRLIGENTGLHPVWIMFGLLAGGALLGFFGVLLAVPLTAIIGVVIRFSIKKYKNSEFYN